MLHTPNTNHTHYRPPTYFYFSRIFPQTTNKLIDDLNVYLRRLIYCDQPVRIGENVRQFALVTRSFILYNMELYMVWCRPLCTIKRAEFYPNIVCIPNRIASKWIEVPAAFVFQTCQNEIITQSYAYNFDSINVRCASNGQMLRNYWTEALFMQNTAIRRS